MESVHPQQIKRQIDVSTEELSLVLVGLARLGRHLSPNSAARARKLHDRLFSQALTDSAGSQLEAA